MAGVLIRFFKVCFLFSVLGAGIVIFPASGLSAGGCRLDPPKVRIHLPRDAPPWTGVEVRNIARLALNEESLDAVWRWDNMMANPQILRLGRTEKEKIADAVLAYTKLGMEIRYDSSRDRVRFYSQLEELLLDSQRQAERAMLRLQCARPGKGDDVDAVSFPKAVGIPKSTPPGASPVLITQIHVMDYPALDEYRKMMIAKRRTAAALAENAFRDSFHPEESLEGLLNSLAKLEKAIQGTLLSGEQER